MRRERPCVRVYVADLHRTPNLPLCVARCDLVPPGPVAGANPPMQPRLPSKWSFARHLDGRSTLSKDPSQLVAKCGGVVMPVHRHGMLHGSLHKLFVTISRYRDGAIHFAWKFTTVYVFASHDDLQGTFSLGAVLVCIRRRVAPRFTTEPVA